VTPHATGTHNLADVLVVLVGTIRLKFLDALDSTNLLRHLSRQIGAPQIQKPETGHVRILGGNGTGQLSVLHKIDGFQVHQAGPLGGKGPCLVGVAKIDGFQVGGEISQFCGELPRHEVAVEDLEGSEFLQGTKFGGESAGEAGHFPDAEGLQVGPGSDLAREGPPKAGHVPQAKETDCGQGDSGKFSLQAGVG